MLHMLLVDNLIHADLHPGNILGEPPACCTRSACVGWVGGCCVQCRLVVCRQVARRHPGLVPCAASPFCFWATAH